MDISVSKCGEWCLDAEAMRAVILGKVVWKKCFECDQGKIYVSGGGEVVSASQADLDEFSYIDACEECHGVGLVFIGLE